MNSMNDLGVVLIAVVIICIIFGAGFVIGADATANQYCISNGYSSGMAQFTAIICKTIIIDEIPIRNLP